jgi:Mrp family chromosome partitioning ATPase
LEPVVDQRFVQSPLAAAWRYRWLVLLMVIACGALAYFYSTTTHILQYVARASVVVSDPRSSTLFDADKAGLLEADRYVVDQVAILESDTVALRASEVVGDAEPLFLERFDAVSSPYGYRVASEPGSDEIVVLYTAESEEAAVAAANAVIDAYAEVRRTEALRNSASAVEQLNLSIAQIETELASIQAQIDQARQSPLRADFDEQYRDAFTRLGELQIELETTDDEDELIELRAELRDLVEQFAALEIIAGFEDQQPALLELYKEQTEAIERRSNLAEERDRLLVDTELLSGGVGVATPARFARSVESPIAIMTALGAILGLIAGFGTAYLIANRRRRFTERADPGWILRAPLLAEIPNFHEELVPPPLPARHHAQSASAEAFRFAATSLDLQIERMAEASGDTARVPRVFLVTSATQGEGKTVTVANVAIAAARQGRRVLAIDADFGNQMLTEILTGSAPNDIGITEVVEAGVSLRSATYSLGPPGTLDLLSRGSRPGTAPDFFSLPATRALIQRTGDEYDLVLIDGPPMLQVAYASTLARYVDRVVTVVPHRGSVSRIEDLAQRLQLIGTPLAGYVYNGAPLRPDMTVSVGSLRDVMGEGTSTRSGAK